MKKYLQKLGQNSYKASLEKVDTNTKNKVLLKFSDLIKKNLNKILKQNKKDIKYAKIYMHMFCFWRGLSFFAHGHDNLPITHTHNRSLLQTELKLT